jgi:hypothetical protein
MSDYFITDTSGDQTSLDDYYNPYISGLQAVNTGYLSSGFDISTRYNKLGNRSWLKYPIYVNYNISISGTDTINDRFELKIDFSNPSAYLMTPILGSSYPNSGCLIKVMASTTITFNVNVTGIQFVLVGGGGGGGGTGNNWSTQRNNAGGGGGAGEVLEPPDPITDIFNTLTVVIGSGGAGGAKGATDDTPGYPGVNGGTTTMTTATTTYGALGGGGGASGKGYSTATEGSGGSGGGGGSYSSGGGNPGIVGRYPGNTALTSYVNVGGRGQDNNNDDGSGGGGGGAGQAGFAGGQNNALPNTLGAGGNGHITTTIDTIVTLGGGGGGGGITANAKVGGLGGTGGGGTGGGLNSPELQVVQATPGVANTGGGGGGGTNTHASTDFYRQNGANGGSGVCYILITNSMIS